MAQHAGLAEVLHRDRLPAAGVVRHRQHAERDLPWLGLLEQRFQPVQVHVALERMAGLRLFALRNHEVHRLRARRFDIRAGRVEVRVVGNDLPLATDGREEDALGGSTLVRRDDVRVPGQVFDRRFEPVEAVRARVGVVAAHHRGPLLRGHRRRPAVGQEIDDDVLGPDAEHVVAGLFEDRLPLLRGRHADRLDDLDLEGLDDSPEHTASITPGGGWRHSPRRMKQIGSWTIAVG